MTNTAHDVIRSEKSGYKIVYNDFFKTLKIKKHW